LLGIGGTFVCSVPLIEKIRVVAAYCWIISCRQFVAWFCAALNTIVMNSDMHTGVICSYPGFGFCEFLCVFFVTTMSLFVGVICRVFIHCVFSITTSVFSCDECIGRSLEYRIYS